MSSCIDLSEHTCTRAATNAARLSDSGVGVAAADRYVVSGSARIIIILMTAVFSPADGPQEERGDARGLGKFTAAVVERGAAAESGDIGRALMKTMESLLINAVPHNG